MRKTIIPFYIFLIGVLSIIADAVIHGEYTGYPNTIFGVAGIILMVVMIIVLIFKS